jgi:pimeloyl-ACP methyl ester carboxylesterase
VSEFAGADGTRIFYEARGTGPTVLVCAGGPSTTFDYLVTDLSSLEATHRLVYHDYRGSGRSSSADESTYTFDQLADDVAALADHLAVPHFDVIAHSMGGFVALACALRHPDRVRRLVLVDTSPSGSTSRMALPTLRALGPLRTLKLLGRAVTYLTWWAWRPASQERTLARFSIMATMQEGSPRYREAVKARETFADNANASRLERCAASYDAVDRLSSIQIPTLVIYGTRDAPFVAGSRILLEHLPDSEELRLDGVGHHPLVEANQDVVDAIGRFLSRS